MLDRRRFLAGAAALAGARSLSAMRPLETHTQRLGPRRGS